MKSTPTPHFSGTFDSVIWKGAAPHNKVREELLAQLCQFLGYGQPLATELGQGSRQLILGNAEDYDTSWPRADGKNLFIGLFCKEFPKSDSLLKVFEENSVSFYLQENLKLEDAEEFLTDLLKS